MPPPVQQALQRATAKAALGRGGSSSSKIVLAANLARSERRRKLSREPPKQAEEIMSFSLSEPPPFDVRAPELLHEVLGSLPEKLRCPIPEFESDATRKEACLLVTHTFWYLFVSLHLPHLLAERHELLRLMAVQYARLTIQLACEHDRFLDAFAPLVAHVELVALRRHGALGSQSLSAGQQGPMATAVFRHLLALLGAAPMSAERFTLHMRFAERPWTDPAAAAKRGNVAMIPWSHGAERGVLKGSPLGPVVIPPLPQIAKPAADAADPSDAPSGGGLAGGFPSLPRSPSSSRGALMPSTALSRASSGKGLAAAAALGSPGGRASASVLSPLTSRQPKPPAGWGKVRQLVKVQTQVDAVSKLKRDKAASTGALLGMGGRQYRPARMQCDLKRQSPLVAIYQGVPPAEVLRDVDLAELASRTGYARPPADSSSSSSSSGGLGTGGGSSGNARAVTVRHSVPGVGGRSRLGGAASFQALQPSGLVERSRARLSEYERDCQTEDATMMILRAAIEQRCDGIDRQRDEKLLMPRPELADYSLELAHQALNPSPLRMAKDY